jgi:hypothetical protein
MHNVPVDGDVEMGHMGGWDDFYPYTYSAVLRPELGFPAPGSDWEDRSYTFHVDSVTANGVWEVGEPEATWTIPTNGLAQLPFVQDVSVSGGVNPTISWKPAPDPDVDAYRIRLFPIGGDRNPDRTDILFETGFFPSGETSYSYTYTGSLFSIRKELAVVIEAMDSHEGHWLNRSSYYVRHGILGMTWSEHRYYEPPFSLPEEHFMMALSEPSIAGYPVWMHNVPVDGDVQMTHVSGWDDFYPFMYVEYFRPDEGFLAPGPDWEGETYTFHVDSVTANGVWEVGELEATWTVPGAAGTLYAMPFVQDVIVSGGANPTISWSPAPDPGVAAYRIRLFPIGADGNPDRDNLLFSSGFFPSGETSYSYTYTGSLFSQWVELAVSVEAMDSHPGGWLNRSIYYVRHSVPPTLESMQISPCTQIEDYRMVSFTLKPDNPACMSVFGPEMGGSYDQENFRFGTYDPTLDGGSYLECGAIEIAPGQAYWSFARGGVVLRIDGMPASLNDTDILLLYNVSNGNGWNQIGCPNAANYYWDDVQVLDGTTVIGTIADPTTDAYIDKRLWCWENGSYFSDNILMEQGEGYWVRAKQANVSLRFRRSVQVAELSDKRIMFADLWGRAKRWTKKWVFGPEEAVAYSDDYPPMPMGLLSSDALAPESVVDGEAGGCFVDTME